MFDLCLCLLYAQSLSLAQEKSARSQPSCAKCASVCARHFLHRLCMGTPYVILTQPPPFCICLLVYICQNISLTALRWTKSHLFFILSCSTSRMCTLREDFSICSSNAIGCDVCLPHCRCDPASFTSRLETEYRSMWQKYCTVV